MPIFDGATTISEDDLRGIIASQIEPYLFENPSINMETGITQVVDRALSDLRLVHRIGQYRHVVEIRGDGIHVSIEYTVPKDNRIRSVMLHFGVYS